MSTVESGGSPLGGTLPCRERCIDEGMSLDETRARVHDAVVGRRHFFHAGRLTHPLLRHCTDGGTFAAVRTTSRGSSNVGA